MPRGAHPAPGPEEERVPHRTSAAAAHRAPDRRRRTAAACAGPVTTRAPGVGDTVDDTALPDETGTLRSPSGFPDEGPVVLFFHPNAHSPGRTAEACHFRGMAAEFAAAGAQPVGVSGEAVDRRREFADSQVLGHPLLSDPDGAVRERFGVTRGFSLAPTRRGTFVVARDRTVLEVVRSELRMNAPADRALAALRSRNG